MSKLDHKLFLLRKNLNNKKSKLLLIVIILLSSLGILSTYTYATTTSIHELTFNSNIILNEKADFSEWGITRIVVSVPEEVTTGNITLSTDDGTSNGVNFTIGDKSVPDENGADSTYDTTISGIISTNTIWSSNVLVTGDVTVNADVTLTINPGVTVLFEAGSDDRSEGRWSELSEINVLGTIISEGTTNNPIYFSSNADSPDAEDWGGISFDQNGAVSSSFEYSAVRYATNGINVSPITDGVYTFSVPVRNCRISDNVVGINFRTGSGYPTSNTLVYDNIVSNNVFENNTYGLYLHMGEGYGSGTMNPTVTNNIFSNNDYGILTGTYSWWLGHVDMYPVIRNNLIENNTIAGISSICHGSSDSSGSDSDTQVTIENNFLNNNGDNILLYLRPYGSDGLQILSPIIRYNTIINGTNGINITDDGTDYDTLNPNIRDNIFYGNSSYDINNNTTGRAITSENNFWGNSETNWDIGNALTTGTVDTSPFSNSTSNPIITKIDSAVETIGSSISIYGANFSDFNLSYCGDSATDEGEECDDGNATNGDGCSSSCLIESYCGDGTKNIGEECDDGNTVNGDSCSSLCTLEPVTLSLDLDSLEYNETDEVYSSNPGEFVIEGTSEPGVILNLIVKDNSGNIVYEKTLTVEDTETWTFGIGDILDAGLFTVRINATNILGNSTYSEFTLKINEILPQTGESDVYIIILTGVLISSLSLFFIKNVKHL